MNELIKPKVQSNEFHTTWEDDYIGDIYYDDERLECGCCSCCGCTCNDEFYRDSEEEYEDDYERQNEEAKEFMKILRSK